MRHFLYSLFFISTVAFGQDVEQLRAELNKASSDTARARVFYQLSKAYRQVDSAKVLEYGRSALKIWQGAGDYYMTGRTYYTMGIEYQRFSDFPSAKQHFLLAKEQFERLLPQDSTDQYLKWWIKSNFNYGACLHELGMLDERIKLYTRIAPLAEKIRAHKILAMINTNLGISFYNLEQYTKAYEYFVASEPMYRYVDATSQFVQDRLAFSVCLQALDSLSKMRIVLNQVKDSLSNLPDASEWTMYYVFSGEYYTAKKEFQAALSQYHEAYQLTQIDKMPFYLKDIYKGYATVYTELGNYPLAEEYLHRTMKESLRYDDVPNQLLTLKALAALEKRKYNYKKAFQYLDDYIALNDSINMVTLQTRATQLETEYQTEQKEREILTLERQNYQAGLALEKEQFRSYLHVFVFSSMLVLLVSGGYIFFRKKQHEAEKREQERKIQVHALQHQQQTQVLSALIEGQEKERQRLASDLHDGLAGRLSGIAFNLATFTQEAHPKPEAHDIRNIVAHMNSALAELRCIARNLTPKTLSEKGLQVALEDYCSSLKGIGSNIVLQFYDTEETLEEQVSLTLYRIIQELIHNAVKYAQASEILVQYVRENHAVNITVEDDGVGFDLHRLPSGSSMGLVNVRTRVSYLNGNMEIQSSPGRGTTVWIQVSV